MIFIIDLNKLEQIAKPDTQFLGHFTYKATPILFEGIFLMTFDVTLTQPLPSLINSIWARKKVKFQCFCKVFEVFEVSKLSRALFFLLALSSLLHVGAFCPRMVLALLLARVCFFGFLLRSFGKHGFNRLSFSQS